MTELLSPAGDKDAFIAAIQSGADAVYMGIDRFNARNMAKNFSIEEYISCIDYAHIYGVKVYLTLNTLLKTDEIKEALEITLTLYNHGLDAVILQDIGMAYVIKNNIPDLALHASTQMTVHNVDQAKFLKEFGFKRIVLAREMTLDEIDEIKRNVDIELEVFIHGALCVSYSGQCLMSYMIGNRSANAGRCAGTCRLLYGLYENGKLITKGHLLSKKDIFGIEYVKRLEEIGVTSLKIEGRGKTKEYVHVITSKYRKMLDKASIAAEDEKDMLQIFNRTSKSSGYFDKVLSKESISYKMAKNTGLYLGRVLDRKSKLIKIKLEEDISMHDGIESLDNENATTIVTCIKDEKGNIINKTLGKGKTVFLGDFNVLPNVNDRINKTSSKIQLDMARDFLSKVRRKVDVDLNIFIKKSECISIEYTVYNTKNKFGYDYIPEASLNKSVNEDDVIEAFSKTENEPFNFNILNISVGDFLFIPRSVLNDVRRKIIENIKESLKVRKSFRLDFHELNISDKCDIKSRNKVLYLYKYGKEKINKFSDIDTLYINISDIKEAGIQILDEIKKDIYVVLPNVILKNMRKYIDENLENIVKNDKVKGIALGNIGYLDVCKSLKEKYKLKLVIDYALNVSNIYSAYFYKKYYLADAICLGIETSMEDIDKIKDLVNVEVIEDYVTVMTSRFCPIKAFAGKCKCKESEFKLVDSYNNDYFIVSDSSDCIIRLVRKLKQSSIHDSVSRVRKSVP